MLMSRRCIINQLCVISLTCLLTLAGGCDRLGWLNINFIIPLGLSDTPGLFNGFGTGSIFFPPANGELDPPLPIQIGEPPGGPGSSPDGGGGGGGVVP
jgi:hypothetical protein